MYLNYEEYQGCYSRIIPEKIIPLPSGYKKIFFDSEKIIFIKSDTGMIPLFEIGVVIIPMVFSDINSPVFT